MEHFERRKVEWSVALALGTDHFGAGRLLLYCEKSKLLALAVVVVVVVVAVPVVLLAVVGWLAAIPLVFPGMPP